MAIIGVIAVYKCDGCSRVLTLHTDADLKQFASWASGKTHDFCPDCVYTNRQINPKCLEQAGLATEKIIAGVVSRLRGVRNARPEGTAKEAA